MTGSVSTHPDALERLRNVGERGTPARVAVLDILFATQVALTHQEVELAARQRGVRVDRVTLYRVLDWLVARGLAHKIEGRDRIWRFNAVVRKEHVHFHCTACGRVYCLDLPLPPARPQLPDGFRFEKAEWTLQGLCPDCARG